jgi:hypothetical protein
VWSNRSDHSLVSLALQILTMILGIAAAKNDPGMWPLAAGAVASFALSVSTHAVHAPVLLSFQMECHTAIPCLEQNP